MQIFITTALIGCNQRSVTNSWNQNFIWDNKIRICVHLKKLKYKIKLYSIRLVVKISLRCLKFGWSNTYTNGNGNLCATNADFRPVEFFRIYHISITINTTRIENWSVIQANWSTSLHLSHTVLKQLIKCYVVMFFNMQDSCKTMRQSKTLKFSTPHQDFFFKYFYKTYRSIFIVSWHNLQTTVSGHVSLHTGFCTTKKC